MALKKLKETVEKQNKEKEESRQNIQHAKEYGAVLERKNASAICICDEIITVEKKSMQC